MIHDFGGDPSYKVRGVKSEFFLFLLNIKLLKKNLGLGGPAPPPGSILGFNI